MYSPDKNKVTQYALMVADAFNHCVDNRNTAMPPIQEDSVIGKDWVVDGYIVADTGVANDVVAFGRDVAFGYVVHSKSDPEEQVVIIRGTGTTLEWIDNMKTLPIDHPSGNGHVEDGFFDIYKTMRFIKTGDSLSQAVPLAKGVADLVEGTKSKVSVIGHSLGATLSTYLTYDLAGKEALDDRVSMCVFASPKPGDREFVNSFENTVKNYIVYNYTRDVVPDVPLGIMGYRCLPRMVEITPETSEAIINNGLMSNHHVVCYAAMLNFGYVSSMDEWRQLLVANHDEPYCIIGENRPLLSRGLNKIGTGLMAVESPKSSRFGVQGYTTQGMMVTLASLASVMTTGAFSSTTSAMVATAAAAGVGYGLRDGGIEVSAVVKSHIRSIKQWSFQQTLNGEMKKLFHGKADLDQVTVKIASYKEQCKEMYEPLQQEMAYMGIKHIDRFEARHKEALYSIELLEVTARTQKMVQVLDRLQTQETYSNDDIKNIITYHNMLDKTTPCDVHDIQTYAGKISHVCHMVLDSVQMEQGLRRVGLADPLNMARVQLIEELDSLVTSESLVSSRLMDEIARIPTSDFSLA